MADQTGMKGDNSSSLQKINGLPDDELTVPRTGLWDNFFLQNRADRCLLGDDLTARKAVMFLDDARINVVEDWGCGYGGLKSLLPERIRYVGIDGSSTPYADQIVDLETFRSSCDALFMRGVLEHNPNWEKVLNNALSSFSVRMVLVLFTPWQSVTRVLAEYPRFCGDTRTMWDIGFRKEDLTGCFSQLHWTSEENIPTATQYGVEHIFYLER